LIEKLSFKTESSEKFDVNFDEYEGWALTSHDKILNVTLFNSGINGLDANCEDALENICD
jgi:hypothetical protein